MQCLLTFVNYYLFMLALCQQRLIDGAISGKLFFIYLEQLLVDTICKDDIVVLDNLSLHKVVGVKVAIERVGAKVVYLEAIS